MLLLKLDYLICNNSTAHLSALCFAHTLDASSYLYYAAIVHILGARIRSVHMCAILE